MLKRYFILMFFCLVCIPNSFANNEIYSKDCSIKNKGIKYYENKVKENPKDICSYYNLSIAYANKNRVNDELYSLYAISVINPKDIDAYKSRALIYSMHNNQDSYYREYAHAVNNIPDYAEGHKIVAEAYENILDYENALKHINAAIKLTKEPDESLLYKKAGIYQNMGRYNEAINEYTKISDINPLASNVHFFKAICYMEIDRYDDAIKEYTILLEKNPSDSHAYDGRSVCYKKIGDTQKAEYDRKMSLKYKKQIGFIDKINLSLFGLKEKIHYKRLPVL